MKGKMLAEHDDHFVVDDGQGPLKIAKLHLHHGTVQRIRQHFAQGGEVQPEADTDPSTGAPLYTDASEGPGLARRMAGAVLPLDNPAVAPAPTPAASGLPDLLAAPDPAALPPAQGTPPAGAAPALPGAPPDLAAGAKQEQAGVKQRAGVVAAEGSAQASTLDSLGQQRQALAADFQQRLAANQAQADKIFADIQSNKVDPNRLWNTASTGGKISASIGIILGGIGAGLTHGPNYALQSIDKAIDRDVEAQKLELGKKENLLSHYMQQGNSIMAAHSLAKADLLDVASAQMQKTAAQYAGQKAAADAQIATGQLRQQAAVLRQQGTERELQIKSSQIGLQQQQAQAVAMKELMKGISGGGGFDRRVLEMPAFKEFRERAVDLPDGSVAFAPDKEEANKSREGFATLSTIKAKLTRFADLAKNGSPSTTDRGTATALRADIMAEMGHLHGLNRLTKEDLLIFDKQVPDLADLVKPFAAQKLRALGKSIDDRSWALQQNYLSRPGARRPGG